MNVVARRAWSREEFFAWAELQDGRFEFDGAGPVDMNGVTVNHAIIVRNLVHALATRLRGGPCMGLGPDAGIATNVNAVRYPDMLVTCTKQDGTARLVTGATVIFEVISPTSARNDRIVKVREYAGVSTVRRYVILESTTVGLTLFERDAAGSAWQATTLSGDDVLAMPEIGVSVPVAEFYEDVQLAE